ncbi:hypothetical protein DFS34DRAFT_449642 [Phlyctochytrium arcticum]|nr:hypothetical protein DFS34DRAFT_449642 [Phlyctochytrium arcticum]
MVPKAAQRAGPSQQQQSQNTPHGLPHQEVALQNDDSGGGSAAQPRQTVNKHRTPTHPTNVWACDRCYRLKYKCDSKRPTCGRCVLAGLNCKYGSRQVRSVSDPSRGRKRNRRYDTAGYIRMLEAKMREMEDTFSTMEGGGRPPSQSPDAQTQTPVAVSAEDELQIAQQQPPYHHPSQHHHPHQPPNPHHPHLPRHPHQPPQAHHHHQAPMHHPQHLQHLPPQPPPPQPSHSHQHPHQHQQRPPVPPPMHMHQVTFEAHPHIPAPRLPPAVSRAGHPPTYPPPIQSHLPPNVSFTSLMQSTLVQSPISDFNPIGITQQYITAEDLCSSEVTHDILRSYFDDVAYRWLQSPVHEATFMADIGSQSLFLIYGLCAMSASASDNPCVSLYLEERSLPKYRAGEVFFKQGLQMLHEAEQQPSVDHVIGLGTLKVAATMINEPHWSGVFRKKAMDMALQLKLHVDPDIESVHGILPWLEKEKRRRTWWGLFVMDTIDCNRGDSTPIIPHHIQPEWDLGLDKSWAVKAISPEVIWISVRTLYDAPIMSAFIPGVHLDAAALSHLLTGLYMRIQKLHGTIWGLVDQATHARGRAPSIPFSDSSCRSVPTVPVHSVPPHPSHPSHALPPSRANQSAIPALSAQAVGYPDVTHALTDEIQAQIAVIDGKLKNCLYLLPAWARSLEHYDKFTSSTASTYPPPWQLYSQHLVWHCLNIALHLPTLFIDGQSVQAAACPSPRLTVAYSTCLAHANQVSQLLHKLQRMNPEGKHITQWVCYFLFYSALVLVMASKTSMDDQHLFQIRRNLDAHLWFTKALGERYFLANYMYDVMNSLLAEGFGNPAELGNEPILAAWHVNSNTPIVTTSVSGAGPVPISAPMPPPPMGPPSYY